MGEIITAPPAGSLAALLFLLATPAKQAPKSRKGFAIQASPATLHTFLEIWAVLCRSASLEVGGLGCGWRGCATCAVPPRVHAKEPAFPATICIRCCRDPASLPSVSTRSCVELLLHIGRSRICVCACMCACVCACARACARACVRACRHVVHAYAPCAARGIRPRNPRLRALGARTCGAR